MSILVRVTLSLLALGQVSGFRIITVRIASLYRALSREGIWTRQGLNTSKLGDLAGVSHVDHGWSNRNSGRIG
jgi:hypothetical protein